MSFIHIVLVLLIGQKKFLAVGTVAKSWHPHLLFAYILLSLYLFLHPISYFIHEVVNDSVLMLSVLLRSPSRSRKMPYRDGERDRRRDDRDRDRRYR